MSRQAFEEHVKKVQSSSEFKEVGKRASHFFTDIRDFIFGRPATMENAVRFTLSYVGSSTDRHLDLVVQRE